MKRKSRVEILRGKLRRMGERDDIHPEMPEDVAEAFVAHLRFDPCVGPIMARDWRPDHRNEQPWIKKLLDDQPRIAAEGQARAALRQAKDEPVN